MVSNGKGGVLKTSLTANVAGLAATSGWRVLAVDLDPQGNLATDLGVLAESDGGAGLLDAVTGTGWRLVLDGATSLPRQMLGTPLATLLPLQAVRISCEPLADMLCETDGVLAAWFLKHRCNAVLVRPDQYVYGVAETPDGIASLWAELEASLT